MNRNGNARPRFRRNETALTFGGPIIKDKLFFFAAVQRTGFLSGYASNVRTRETIEGKDDKTAPRVVADELGGFITGALAVASELNPRGQRLAVVPLIYDNRLAVIDLNSNKLLGKADTGIAPFGAAINRSGTVAYVTNWGGRLPKHGELTLPTGLDPRADHVVVDDRGIASTGTVTRIDLATMKATHQIPVELHPTAIAWDVVRAQIFNADLKKWEAAGQMPNFVILQLPSDHMRGTSPGAHTPKAMVADNDLALGQIVEALSKSQFWKKMAIFVVEDDAQNGVDHVDGHRTVALAVSPYIRRGYVDSTFYAHQSILKTIELILGLPTLSLFDLIANDMRASFTNAPDLRPYAAVEPKQSLFELNPPLTSLRGQARRDAIASMKMRFDVPDAVPTERLNRIVWRQVKGRDTPYPSIKQAVFAPLSVDVEDEERERP